jgi:hypothetical protein
MHLISSRVGVPRTWAKNNIKLKGKQIKGSNLLGIKRVVYLDDFNKLINTTVTWEERLLKKKSDNMKSFNRSDSPPMAHVAVWSLTCPKSNSARTQPADQTSIAVVYSVAPNMSSGAL